MNADVNPLAACCERLRGHLFAAIELESTLAAKLREHENALMRGEVDRIHTINKDLDGFLGSLRGLASELQVGAFDLAELLNLPPRTPLKESLFRLPSPAREDLSALRQRLLMARRAAQTASSKNAAIARASLDAIHGVKELLGRSPGANSNLPAEPISAGGRLDTEA
jgi:hypothetical protein